MFIHSEIQKLVLPLLDKYELNIIDLVGEMNHAAWELTTLNGRGIERLIVELNKETE